MSEEGLQIAEEKHEVKGRGEREMYTELSEELQRVDRRGKKAFLKETEENDRMGKTRDLFKKTEYIKGTFHASGGTIKDRNGKDLRENDEIVKRGQEYTKLYKKGLNELDYSDGVVTHLDTDTLECEVK